MVFGVHSFSEFLVFRIFFQYHSSVVYMKVVAVSFSFSVFFSKSFDLDFLPFLPSIFSLLSFNSKMLDKYADSYVFLSTSQKIALIIAILRGHYGCPKVSGCF